MEPRFEIVVRAFILDDDGRVLLAKRAKEPEKNKWSLVGGKVEWHEKAIDAVVREVKEELNIIFVPTFEFYTEYFFPNKKHHCHILYFSGSYSGTIHTKKDEITDVKFFSITEIQEMKDIAWDHGENIQRYFK
ncbi:MAG: NUDIX hydrolase [Candidatus Roizmanbacteria bacterium]